MQPRDKKRFVELMMALGEAFDKIPSSPKMEIYYRSLEDMDIKDLSQACSDLIKTRTITGTFPLVAEIRNIITKNATITQMSGHDSWGKLLVAAERSLPQPELSPAEEMALRSIGGWERLCLSSYDDLKFRRREYLEALADSQGREIYYDDGRNILDEAARRRQRMIE